MKSVKIPFGSETHKKVLASLNARKDLSKNEMCKRHSAWKADDDDYTAYVKVSDADKIRKKEKALGTEHYLTLNVPYSYAQLMSYHTYVTSVFLSRDPVMQFAGRHGEPEMNVQAVEALMAYQTVNGKHLAPYFVWLHDAGRYGLGVLWNYWEDETHYVSEVETVQKTLGGVAIIGQKEEVKRTRAIKGYQGGKVFNVSPYDYLPDPRVPLTDPQKGEFVGRLVAFYWNEMLRRKQTGQYIAENVDVAKERMKQKTASERENYRNSRPNVQGDMPSFGGADVLSGAEGYEMVVELVPKDWMLGTSEFPEKWCFSVVDDAVIVEARPLGLYHNKFPASILESEVDGYSLHKRSLLAISRPLNETLNWLINSHYYEVRNSLAGQIIFDPSRLNAKDILDPAPGMRGRVTPLGYGQDIRSMIHVIQGTGDVTKTHMQDSQQIENMLQRILGINDSVMGMNMGGGRKSATEVRTSTSASVNRMKTISEYFSATGFSDNAQMLLAMSQQLYKDEKKFKLVGDQLYSAQGMIEVTPDAIAGSYDFVPVDGTLPVDRFAMVNSWTQLFAQLRNFPQIMQTHDMGKIFEWVANMGGLKNIRQFRLNPLSPEQIQAEVQRGNMVRMGDERSSAGGPSAGGPAPTSQGIAGGVPIPAQIPGVGAAG